MASYTAESQSGQRVDKACITTFVNAHPAFGTAEQSISLVNDVFCKATWHDGKVWQQVSFESYQDWTMMRVNEAFYDKLL